MADILTPAADRGDSVHPLPMPKTLDEARSMARQRFKERLENGEKIGNCDCGDEATPVSSREPTVHVAGVRFLDSGRMYYFDPQRFSLDVGDWVVVETSRGKEAGRVVLAPHQVRQNMLQGELKPVQRRLETQDIERMQRFKREAATAIKTFGAKIRERKLPMKPITAEYNFDGSHLALNFTSTDRVDFRNLAKELATVFRCRVELRQVGPRDEARLLGGLGRCGRTLCCSSWLPVYPEISMNMAKTQDLPLNPGKVSGVCGRLLCCLSYENEQYRQMKAVMPRLGQTIETPAGPGMVVSMQILKELVTVRMADNTDQHFAAADLGFRKAEVAPPTPISAPVAVTPMPREIIPEEPTESGAGDPPVEAVAVDATADAGRKRRRRGRGGGRGPAVPRAS
ncbi:MAG: PSP1 domain-containing protein [Thermomicrobiales bacterium]